MIPHREVTGNAGDSNQADVIGSLMRSTSSEKCDRLVLLAASHTVRMTGLLRMENRSVLLLASALRIYDAHRQRNESLHDATVTVVR